MWKPGFSLCRGTVDCTGFFLAALILFSRSPLLAGEILYVNQVQGAALFDRYPGVAESRRIALLPFNAPLRLLEKGEEYDRVQYREESGWISAKEIGPNRGSHTMYVHTLFPVRMSREPGSDAGGSDPVLRNGAKLLIRSGSVVSGVHYLEGVTERGGAGWIRDTFVRKRPMDYFLYIYPYDGVTLRREPALSSEAIRKVPHGALLKILDLLDARAEKTADSPESTPPGGESGDGPQHDSRPGGDGIREGIWFYAKSGRRAGWAFFRTPVLTDDPSGMRTNLLRDADDSFRRYLDRPASLPEITEDLAPVSGHFAKKTSLVSGHYDILALSRDVDPDSCEQDPVSRIVFRNRATGKLYGIVPGYSETIQEALPLKDLLYTMASHCNCCCPFLTNQLYLLLSERILVFEYLNENVKGAGLCEYGPVYRILPGREIRFARDRNGIFIHMRLPACPLEGFASEAAGNAVYPRRSLHELFLLLEVDATKNRFIVEKFYDGGIPVRFQKEWDAAASLPLKQYEKQ